MSMELPKFTKKSLIAVSSGAFILGYVCCYVVEQRSYQKEFANRIMNTIERGSEKIRKPMNDSSDGRSRLIIKHLERLNGELINIKNNQQIMIRKLNGESSSPANPYGLNIRRPSMERMPNPSDDNTPQLEPDLSDIAVTPQVSQDQGSSAPTQSQDR